MKRTTCIIAVLLTAVLLLAACASGGGGGGSSSPAASAAPAAAAAPAGRKVAVRVPAFVMEAIMNAPEDALVGIGMANMASPSQSMTFAQTRGRAEISRQMSTMVQDMIRDYTASSEIDHSAAISFQENITVALSKSELKGSRVVKMDFDENGACWAVMQLGKASLVEEINQTQAAAKLAVPAMASFNAEDRMNAAFANAYNNEVQVGDR